LVEEYAHLGRSQGATRRMLQYGANLLNCDAGEPLNELRYERPIFEILEERCDGHSGTTKYPGATHALGIAFDRRTCGPVNHGLHGTTGSQTAKTANASLYPPPARAA